MKRVWTAVLPIMLCVILAGCSTLEPPGEDQIVEDLDSYYQRQDYKMGGENGKTLLQPISSAEILEQEVDNRERTAVVRCRVRAVAEGELFERSDLWELQYTYSKTDAQWELTDKECLETAYELLSDLEEELCLKLLGEHVTGDYAFVSVVTDRTTKTATAVYTYEDVTGVLGDYGTITLHASVDASFSWSEDGGWQYTGSARNEDSEYVCDLRCHIGFDGKGMLSTDAFTVGFDLVVIDNLVCIENLTYQGNVCTLGTMHIGNAEFSAIDEGTGACIAFDFVRDAYEIENDKNYIDSDEFREFYKTISGTGTVTITADETGECFAELCLPGFIAWHQDTWTDFIKDMLKLEKVAGNAPQLPPGFIDTPIPVPTLPPTLPGEPYSVGGGEHAERTCAGEWIFTAPQGSGISGTVKAELRDDGTCNIVYTFELGAIDRNTTYLVVEDFSQLPTDLIETVAFGGTPTVSVVYDAQEDVLYTCLQEGMYIYLSRADSGETGGFYEPK